MRRGIPVTTPARTLHDLRPFLSEVEFTNVLREAEFRRLQIGNQNVSDGARSELERRMLALCRRHRLPQPDVNVSIDRPLRLGFPLGRSLPDRRGRRLGIPRDQVRVRGGSRPGRAAGDAGVLGRPVHVAASDPRSQRSRGDDPCASPGAVGPVIGPLCRLPFAIRRKVDKPTPGDGEWPRDSQPFGSYRLEDPGRCCCRAATAGRSSRLVGRSVREALEERWPAARLARARSLRRVSRSGRCLRTSVSQ